MELIMIVISFIISLMVSSIIIYFATKLFAETEGFGTAILAAFIGAIIYALISIILGTGFIASIIGGLAWLFALGSLYKMGWIKSFFVAIIIWIFTAIISWILPTLIGPL